MTLLNGCNLKGNSVAFGGQGGAIKVAAESNLVAIDTVGWCKLKYLSAPPVPQISPVSLLLLSMSEDI